MAPGRRRRFCHDQVSKPGWMVRHSHVGGLVVRRRKSILGKHVQRGPGYRPRGGLERTMVWSDHHSRKAEHRAQQRRREPKSMSTETTNPPTAESPSARLIGYAPVAVLFARSDSIYKMLPGLDVWDAERDALNWNG